MPIVYVTGSHLIVSELNISFVVQIKFSEVSLKLSCIILSSTILVYCVLSKQDVAKKVGVVAHRMH